jgi:hypothetical protein
VLQDLDPGRDILWHRVVNAKGEVSYSPSRNGGDALQQRLLEKEGVEPLQLGAVSLARIEMVRSTCRLTMGITHVQNEQQPENAIGLCKIG